MGIWCECIKWFRKPKRKGESPFTNLNSSNYIYTYSETYLGAKAKVFLCDSTTEFQFSFSVKDGILVKIKSNQPYRILFDYVNGSYYINDNDHTEYNRLVESLSAIKNDPSIHDYSEMYTKLEEIMYDFIISTL